jgi:hypothetical protein
MSGFRIPVVAGVSGGVGTSTVALALHARDGGTEIGSADVVVCRGTAESLSRAGRMSAMLGGGPPLVLAVTCGPARRGRIAALLAEAGPGWSAVVELPMVTRWLELDDPYAEVTDLLGTQRETLPRPVRAYATAIGRLARAVADSGRLSAPAPRALVAAPPARPAPRPLTALPAAGPHATVPPDEPEAVVPGLRPVRGIRILATPATGSRPPALPAVNGARR